MEHIHTYGTYTHMRAIDLCVFAPATWTPAALSTSAKLGWFQGMGSYMALDGVLNGLKWGCIHLCVFGPTFGRLRP
jgi:hypothetical protein